MFRLFTTFTIALALTACASSPASEKTAQTPPVSRWEMHAGALIQDFHFTQLSNWEDIDHTTVVVWTRPNEAYLLKLRGFCNAMRDTAAIGLSSTGNRVRAGFDAVVAGGERCPIHSIQRVDLEGMAAEAD